MRVDVLVITDRKPRTLRVKRGPFVNGEGTQDVFVVRGDRAVKTPVEIGVVGFDYCEVASGVAEGEEILLSDMRDYAQGKELKSRWGSGAPDSPRRGAWGGARSARGGASEAVTPPN